MSLLASLAILPAVLLLPQGDQTPATPPAAQAKPALLQPAEQAALRTTLVKYLEAHQAWEVAEGSKDREKMSKRRETAKDALQKAWDKTKSKGDLLSSMADLRAIYDNCFVVKPVTFSLATLRKDTVKVSDTVSYDYSIYLPKTYKADKPWRTVLVLPGTIAADQPAKWVEGREYFKHVWEKAPFVADTIFHMSHLPDGLEMDGPPDYSREGQEAEEDRRIEAVFRAFGLTMSQTANVDRGRVFVDCGRGNCGFGVRFVSMFPDRFAGLVLRQPVAVDELRLGSLLGIPVLMIKTAATATVVDALKTRLEAVTPGSVKVIEATDEYPHAGATAEIETWMHAQRRNMCPARVVIEPNHDRFNRAYWVRMGRMDPLHTAPVDQKARIEVQADPLNNRIVVTARGVENFTLLLNDDLVDLDKPFTVVVNEKAVGPEKRTRDATGMQKRVLDRVDWEFLFPVEFNSTVPKAVVEKADDKKGIEPQADEKK
jgi:hypothetical protein